MEKESNPTEQLNIAFNSTDFVRKANSKAANIMLIKAVGLHNNRELTIIDSCAGLGQDGALMATFGAKVTMLERNAILYKALHKALTRATSLYRWGKSIHVRHQDAIDYLQQLTFEQYPDVIYIDPMYPHGQKNPRNKHMLRTLRTLVGDDTDADQLMLQAWGKATHRIVVKRPKKAPFLADKKPSFQYKGNSTRFDIYLSSLWI